MNVILFDYSEIRRSLLPFTHTRPVAAIRIGIFTIAEKWEKYLGVKPSFLTEKYLSGKFPVQIENDNLLINGALCPDQSVLDAIKNLKTGELLIKDNMPLAVKTGHFLEETAFENVLTSIKKTVMEYPEKITLLKNNWDIFTFNGKEIKQDFEWITNSGRTNNPIKDPYTKVYAQQNIFIEEGAQIRAATINAETGPVYIGKNSEIQEGALIRGPFVLCEGATVNMGAKIRNDTTIGPYSKVGGEISNVVIFGYSNKGHDGFLGNSVLGEWCNLGADTNTSNLKNNYTNVKVWNYALNEQVDTGIQFCGLMMGDHSKAGINTMFNTGTIAGVSANIFGNGFPPKFIPSFSWGGGDDFQKYDFSKAIETAQRVMERRGLRISKTDIEILRYIFETEII